MFYFSIASIFYIVNYINAQANCPCRRINTCYQSISVTPSQGEIDVRIVNPGQTPAPPTPTPSPSGNCGVDQQQCCSEPGVFACGLRWYIPDTPNTTPVNGQARYGSEPWQIAILDMANNYLGSGALLNANTVLTAAHKVFGRTAGNFKIQAGVWDANREVEIYKTQESGVSQLMIHPGYVNSANNLFNDIAILKLSTPIRLGLNINPAINTICLPSASTNFDNMKCLVSGWGKNAFTGTYQSIIKEVEVPVISQADCQARLRTTRLGSSYILNTSSFMCAGGEVGKDACVGDGGSPLVCRINGRYQVVGLVSWGIGCANASIPGVYVRVQSYLTWITPLL